MKLNEIKDNLGSTKSRKRIGRGIGSGTGKTSGKGHKGQKSRSGVSIKGFEGGQMPIHRRLPKRGFTNINRVNYTELNLDKIQKLIDGKKIDPKKIISYKTLLDLGLVKSKKAKIKLLGKGDIKIKVDIEVSAFSKSAKENIEKIGGSVIILDDKKISLKTDVNKKHKFALENLNKGENIYLYGVVVGKAIRPIKEGEAINSKNISHHTQEYYLPKNLKKISTPNLSNNEHKNKTFDGYHRQDGKVGTENNWLVIPLVFCQNRNIDELKKALLSGLGYGSSRERVFNLDKLISNFEAAATKSELLNEKVLTSEKHSSQERLFSNVDGIYFLTHEGGCGGSKYDSVSLCNLIAGYINNPNVAGATILSLGCQHAQISLLEKSLKRIAPDFKKTIFFMEQQKSNSEEEYLAECIKKTFIGLIEANKIKRKPAPISKLTLGLECGGSDGFSGISANPVLGFVSDVVVGQGGSAILSEFPELNGVEQELINRCTSLEKAKKFKTFFTILNHSKCLLNENQWQSNKSMKTHQGQRKLMNIREDQRTSTKI